MKPVPSRHAAGLSLPELMVALALTAVLGTLLAALVQGWISVRERRAVRRPPGSLM